LELDAAEQAILRIAFVFQLPPGDIHRRMRFGEDLRVSFRSDWSDNEFDRLLVDIQNMGLNGDDPEIQTVADFCSLAERCAIASPKCWRSLVESWTKEATMGERPRWRRFVYETIGL
jgi:hypothetical protein